VKQEDDEEGVLSRWPKGQTAAFSVNYLDRPQDPEVHPSHLLACPSMMTPAAVLRVV
jgi:hypothetical protein